MGYIQQEMLYLKLTIIRIELYRDLFIHHAFVCRISLLCQPSNRFLTQMNKLIQSVSYSEKSHKISQKHW